ncbi:hypothetical protein ACG94X_07280 [Acinetobacter sp. ULE_I010]|uniref:hypothetical protein n=1 Tax=Acinetobacter sp. ULE_I010 TaxID=3373065 RepID=UPI003AF776B5
MYSTLEINSHKQMTAEQILEEIRFPIENLELTLSALTKMHLDHPLTGDELTALLNTIHYQVMHITKAIH